MEMDNIACYKPCELLQPYVRYHWIFNSRKRFCTLTYPIGCPQIIFHKRTPLFIPELNDRQSRFTISGQVNFPAHVRQDEEVEMIVTVFHPYAIGAFIETPPSSFYNLEISGYDLGIKGLNELASRIFDCENNIHCIQMIEHWLLSKIADVSRLNIGRMEMAVRRLMQKPATPITELSSLSCLGKKQFERVFHHFIGMNPKEYARIVRFQKSLWSLQNKQNNYADIAYANGYADQSHFIREFKAYSGYTPSQILEHGAPYSDLFTNPV